MITFRSFTVKHGVIKQMNIDSPKFENLIDQAFIFIHEQFVDGKFDRSESNLTALNLYSPMKFFIKLRTIKSGWYIVYIEAKVFSSHFGNMT